MEYFKGIIVLAVLLGGMGFLLYLGGYELPFLIIPIAAVVIIIGGFIRELILNLLVKLFNLIPKLFNLKLH